MKELMAFKPSQTPKRPAPGGGTVERQEEERAMEEDPDDSYEARAKKRKLAQKKAQAVCSNLPDHLISLALLSDRFSSPGERAACAVGAGGEAGRHSINYVLFLVALISSVLATILGITKFLKNGPISIIPGDGLLHKAVLVFFSILCKNLLLWMLLNDMLSGRSAEKILLSLVDRAGKV